MAQGDGRGCLTDKARVRPSAVVLTTLLVAATSLSSSQRAIGQDATVEIVVTNASDEVNGDTSSPEALQADPGPDGISLWEALITTNNDPGPYSIRFDATLEGATIEVGQGLPFLTGGGVSIDGDITGDGKGDVTLRAMKSARHGPGVTISSGGNTLHGLALRGFRVGVAFSLVTVDGALPTEQTFAGNTLSGLTIRGGPIGVFFGPNGPECEPREEACATRNRWLNLQIIDNTIHARTGAITINLFSSVGDHVKGLAIKRNTIRIPERDSCLGDRSAGGNAIDVVAGQTSFGDRHNRITDVVIRDNSIRGGAMAGIRVTSGGNGADANTVEHVRVVRNEIDLQPARAKDFKNINKCATQQILVTAGDFAFFQRGTPANENTVQDVEISGNRISGNEGIRAFAGGAGGTRNVIRDLRIAHNHIDVVGPFPGVNIHGAEGGVDRPAKSGLISDVLIDANRVEIRKADPAQLRPEFGAITVIGADSSGFPAGVRDSKVRKVRITENIIDGKLAGVSLVGGFSYPDAEGPAIRNALKDVVVARNRILRRPMSSPSYESGIQGIRIVGGIGGARGNRVTCVRIRQNRVAGAKDVSVVDNASSPSAPGATNNKVSLAC